MPPNDGKLIIEDVDILPGPFKNFSGREGRYNREGDRNFNIRLEEELALQLLQDGWSVKRLKDRETGEEKAGDYILQVHIGYKIRPPLLVLISSKGRVNLSQHECDLLDWVDIKKADVIINPGHYNVNGNVGIKAWVKSLFITIEEDYLDLKYADVPMAQIEAPGPMLQLNAGPSAQSPSEHEAYEDPDDIQDAELVE